MKLYEGNFYFGSGNLLVLGGVAAEPSKMLFATHCTIRGAFKLIKIMKPDRIWIHMDRELNRHDIYNNLHLTFPGGKK